MKKYLKITLIIWLLSLTAGAQVSNLTDKSKNFRSIPEPSEVFFDLENGLKHGDPSKFSKYLSENSYISLPNGVSGYFSSNQSFYILKDFFKSFDPVNFSFSQTGGKKDPVATGGLIYESNGKREHAIVYITLQYESNFWRVTQLTVN
ncbi:MAG: DUF4783 domain-containing protein [Ignavibacteriales bacterium]|jgi:hypothetical protein|nr:DUF4783 domain-containing protein [Ignavibacteriales bacterium]MBK8661639.1 DUF4783 domain-containing protein [Ignavibacteriales bacterium]MBP7542255.1 DUF4783 domain-containing protein [Ignavibacteriaceae bacterium]MBP9123241.1 DUF4783 domain-containing protein [Ignavibacteriaceae bacterium]MCC6636141.1 DUF4783 domain-containing protein [Ignavibacteriaceae bacterium]